MLRSHENAPILFRPDTKNGFKTGAISERRWEELIGAAYQFGFPLFEQARLTYQFSYAADNATRKPVNTFAHARKLVGFNEQRITTPNNDTLYSSAAIDLSAGPIVLEIPEFGPRYWSVSFFDAYTNVFSCVGTRRHGGGGGHFLLVGPGWAGEAGAGEEIIRSPGNHIVALARIQMRGEDDYAVVHAIQDRLKLRALTIPVVRRLVTPRPDNPANFVAVVNQVLRENPTLHMGWAVQENLASVGIGPDKGPLSGIKLKMWKRFYASAKSRLREISEGFGTVVDGWEYLPFNIASFGEDYETRAVIALKGLWANIPAEQIYTFAIADQNNERLSGKYNYRLTLPSARARDGLFWSLSIYERTRSGQLFFRDNVLHRYAVGSASKALATEPDGSVKILIQPEQPAEFLSNWLPSPPDAFSLVMRVYMPSDLTIGTKVFYPPVTRVE